MYRYSVCLCQTKALDDMFFPELLKCPFALEITGFRSGRACTIDRVRPLSNTFFGAISQLSYGVRPNASGPAAAGQNNRGVFIPRTISYDRHSLYITITE